MKTMKTMNNNGKLWKPMENNENTMKSTLRNPKLSDLTSHKSTIEQQFKQHKPQQLSNNKPKQTKTNQQVNKHNKTNLNHLSQPTQKHNIKTKQQTKQIKQH